MKSIRLLLAPIVLVALGLTLASASRTGPVVEVWLTDPGESARFARQTSGLAFESAAAAADLPTIVIDPDTTYQTIDGFGYTLTGGSAMLLHRMSPVRRQAVLKELFGTEGDAIGVSYLRVSIGASDLDERVFSYDDLPPGEVDPELKRFTLAPDRRHLIPILKEILAIAPGLKIMGSPWSPPAWMKDNGQSKGGSLKPEFYRSYARYFVKYVEGMKAEGIPIDAITIQNEPLHPGNNPSLLMPAAQQAEFIKHHLGPAFLDAGLSTKIIVYDHNCDHLEYPISILDYPEAKRFVDGSAFHLYAGKIEAMSKVHDAHPDRNLYFTEQWIGAPGDLRGDLGWHTREVIIGAPRNWGRTALEWNLAADPNQDPHTPGGCTSCLGAITIDGDRITRNPAYYAVAHASKFARPGSVRISSNVPKGLPNVAYRTPDGLTVLIVLNDGDAKTTFALRAGGKVATATLPAGAVATYVWR